MSNNSEASLFLRDFEESSFPEPMNATGIGVGNVSMNHYHWHRHYELLMVYKGNYTLINNRAVIRSSKPAVFLHRPFTLHNMNSSPDTEYVRRLLHIRRDVVNRFTLDVVDKETFLGANLIYAMPDSDEWEELVTYMDLARLKKEDENSAALLISLIIHRIIQIAAAGRGEIVSCATSYIQNVLTFIADHLSESCTIDDIVQRFDVKRGKFQTDFKAATGVPYHQYLVTLRLTRAKEMLLEGQSIQKTAMDTGYNSEAHFVKAFREYWGMTPGQLKGK
ncbi:MAG: helix-turn-helix domain-containing protein [Ruminococcaceae bacterium]|nr:helix-turn-helix domain-containing protein [Oscillospiraceae bacterium]